MTDLQAALQWILTDSDEADHEQIYAAIKQRRNILTTIKASTFRRGDRVVITGKISPKYLLGATGTITALKPGTTRISVTLDAEQPPGIHLGKYGPSPWLLKQGAKPILTPIGIPISCLSPVT